MTDKPTDLLSKCEGGESEFYQIEDGWMETFTGQKFYFLNPAQDTILIEDIAHALAQLCRYGGHSRCFYSVAEHSLHVSAYIQRLTGSLQLAFEALMHDSSEGYLVDMPRPIKHVLKDYRRIEDNLATQIAIKFGLTVPMDRRIHEADSRILVNERASIMSKSGNDWGIDKLEPLPDVHIWGLSSEAAEFYFMRRFNDLNSRIEAGMDIPDDPYSR